MNWFSSLDPYSWSLGRWFGEEYIAEGHTMPPWYGVAWYCPLTARAYCLPIPLNKIVGSFRNWWFALRRPAADDPVADAYQCGYGKGEAEGYRRGEQAGFRVGLMFRDAERKEIV